MTTWDILRWAVMAGALVPLGYYLFATLCSWRYFRQARAAAAAPPDFTPPVSILKPVCGLDPEAYENFASFCRQDYPEFEILFCAADETDPAVPVIQQLVRDFPDRRIRLLIGVEAAGASDKVNKLCRMAREARYGVLLPSDSDVRVTPDFLRHAVGPLRDPRVGVTTCLYLGIVDRQLGAELIALGAATDFVASVLVSRALEGVKFALGAAIAVRREALEAIGGFEALADCFVDDYELGRRIAAKGYRVEFPPVPVWTHYPAKPFRAFFAHQMRWLLAVRHARPAGHAGMLFMQGLVWLIALVLASPAAWIPAAYAGAYLGLRTVMAWQVGVAGLNDALVRRRWWLLPLWDVLWLAAWLASFFSSRIRWRGAEFKLRAGRLIPVEPRAPRG